MPPFGFTGYLPYPPPWTVLFDSLTPFCIFTILSAWSYFYLCLNFKKNLKKRVNNVCPNIYLSIYLYNNT